MASDLSGLEIRSLLFDALKNDVEKENMFLKHKSHVCKSVLESNLKNYKCMQVNFI